MENCFRVRVCPCIKFLVMLSQMVLDLPKICSGMKKKEEPLPRLKFLLSYLPVAAARFRFAHGPFYGLQKEKLRLVKDFLLLTVVLGSLATARLRFARGPFYGLQKVRWTPISIQKTYFQSECL